MARKGEKHPHWKGDEATPQVKRKRAQRWYPLDGVTCETPDCTKPAKERHHVNKDTADNRRENLQFLCVQHHRQADFGKPPQPCANCGTPAKPITRGLCRTCYAYLRRTGKPRPWKKDGRREGASVYHPRPARPAKPCSNCGETPKVLRRGRCRRCYDYFRYHSQEADSS